MYNLPGYFKSFNKGKIYILSVWAIFKNCIFFVNEDLDKGQQPSRIAVTKDDISQIENICSITIMSILLNLVTKHIYLKFNRLLLA